MYPVISKWTEYPKKTALKNDILITVKGSGVGSINLMNEDELCISRQIMAIRCNDIHTDYMFSFLSTQYDEIQASANGAAIPGISRSDVLDLKLSVPKRAMQQNIVNRIIKLRDKLNIVSDKYQLKMQSLEELKKSLFQKAFAGELTKADALV